MLNADSVAKIGVIFILGVGVKSCALHGVYF
jgi:hypothetical protein